MYKVLIVDDEENIRNGLSKRINMMNLEFHVCGTASNGEEAISLINKESPHIVFTDIKMPVMDGIELAGFIKRKHSYIKTVILSGYDDFTYAQKAIEYGVFSYLLKPVKEEDLVVLFNKLYDELNLGDSIRYDRNDDYSTGRVEQSLLKLISSNFTNIEGFKKEAAGVGFKFFEKNICVCVFMYETTDQNANKSSIIEAINEETHKWWNKYQFPIFLYNGYFSIIFHSQTKIMYNDIISRFRNFKTYIENKLSESQHISTLISAGIGSCHEELENISACINEAVYALNFKFFMGKGLVIHYNDVSSKKSFKMDGTHLQKNIEELALAVIEGNVLVTVNKTKNLFNSFLTAGFFNINKLVLKCVEVYILITIRINQEKLPIKVLVEEDILSKLSACESLDELGSALETNVTKLADQINDLKKSGDNNIIIKIKQYIRENIHKKLTLIELSYKFHLSPNYLSTFFSGSTGINLSDYITSARLDKALYFLKESDFQITDIAEKVGFSDYRYFCTVFKKKVGVTPMQYRMKNYL